MKTRLIAHRPVAPINQYSTSVLVACVENSESFCCSIRYDLDESRHLCTFFRRESLESTSSVIPRSMFSEANFSPQTPPFI